MFSVVSEVIALVSVIAQQMTEQQQGPAVMQVTHNAVLVDVLLSIVCCAALYNLHSD